MLYGHVATVFGHLSFNFAWRILEDGDPFWVTEELRAEGNDLVFPWHTATQEFYQPPHD